MTGNKNLEELRQELERQTRETQKLQEEVEQATKLTMEKFSHSLIGGHDLSHEDSVSSFNTSAGNSSVLSVRNLLITSAVHSSRPESTVSAAAAAATVSKGSLVSKYELDIDALRRSCAPTGKPPIEKVLEEYEIQVKELQRRLNETNELHDHQRFHFRQSLIDLQTKLQEVQLERDALADFRRRDSQNQNELMSRLQAIIKEQEEATQLKDKTIREVNNQVEQLKKVIQSHEGVLHGIHTALVKYESSSGKKVYEHGNISGLPIQTLGTTVSKVLRDLEAEISDVKGRLLPMEDEVEILRAESQQKVEELCKEHQERIEQLICDHDEEVSLLSEKVNTARNHAKCIQTQVAIVQEQARNQNAMYMRQLAELESTVSQLRSELREAKRTYEDKIEDLEKQLILARSELTDAKTECDQFSKESGTLDNQLQQLTAELHRCEKELSLEKEQNKRLWDRDTGNSISIDNLRRELDDRNMEVQRLEGLLKTMKDECQVHMDGQMAAIHEQNESLEKVSSLTTQLELTREQLRRTIEDLTTIKMSHEEGKKLVSHLTASLEEKNRAMQACNLEIQNLQLQVEDSLKEVQQVKNEKEQLRVHTEDTEGRQRSVQMESEVLKRQLHERERMTEILQQQMENMTQMASQHGRTVDSLQNEMSHLLKELNSRKMEIRELKIVIEKKDGRNQELEAKVNELDLERTKLQNTETERLQAIKDLSLDRERLINELKIVRKQLSCLVEDYEAMKKNFQNKSEQMESASSKLKAQLKETQTELEQTRNTLKTLEGADGHAMKVAMGMQKQITAKRGQIDALQSKIHFLEEAVENSSKEKHYLKEEKTKLSQELARVATERNKLSGELELLKSQERRLTDKVSKAEGALEKASLQFADCQALLQQQEQEFMRYKLQHALDIKELQVPGHSAPSTLVQRYVPTSVPLPRGTSLPQSQISSEYISTAFPKTSSLKEDPTCDLKQLLQDMKSLINEGYSSSRDRSDLENGTQSRAGTTHAIDDLFKEPTSDRDLHQNSYSREPLTLYTKDLEEPSESKMYTQSESSALMIVSPRYTSSPKKLAQEQRQRGRSPVHSLLTSPFTEVTLSSSLENRTSPVQAAETRIQITTAQHEVTGQSCRKLQNKLENLQNLVEDLQVKNHEMSSMIRNQETRIKKVKEQDKMLKK